MSDVQLINCDCIEYMKTMPDKSADAVICDPPYGLEFMGKEWDSPSKLWDKREKKDNSHLSNPNSKNSQSGYAGMLNNPAKYQAGIAFQKWVQGWATEALRVLKPGGYLLAFGGTRTYHRLTCGLEDAGFVIKDTLCWLYGSGFPKSYNISKGMDAMGKRYEFFDKVRIFLKDSLASSGHSIKQINEMMGLATTGSGMAGHWFANLSQQTLPTKNQWFQLKKILNFNNTLDEVFRSVTNPNERPVIGKLKSPASSIYSDKKLSQDISITAPVSEAAQLWDGYGTALKPSQEPIICAQKPLTIVPRLDKIIEDINQLIGSALCLLLSSVSNVEEALKLSQVGQKEQMSVSVVWLAAVLHGTSQPELYEKMVMSKSQETASTCLNIALLWNNILAVSLNHGNKFTTKTETVLITTLKILKSLLSTNIPACIIQVVCQVNGQQSNVNNVEESLNVEKQNTSDIQKHSVAVNAMLQTGKLSLFAKNAKKNLEQIMPSVNSVLQNVLIDLQTECDLGLFPNLAPIVLAQKPLDGTYCKNIEKHGIGALNVDACRIKVNPEVDDMLRKTSRKKRQTDTWETGSGFKNEQNSLTGVRPAGRFPANLLLDEEAAQILDKQSGILKSGSGCIRRKEGTFLEHGGLGKAGDVQITYGDKAGASRFFYIAKASRTERGKGNTHPTVKPIAIMMYLARLVLPHHKPVVWLDPFLGSGTSALAAAKLNDEEHYQISFIGIDDKEKYLEIAKQRLAEYNKCVQLRIPIT